MANYSIEPTALQPYLPYRTELDTFNGIHYVSLVGFLFANTKVLGVPFPFHRTFEEVNLRFYVRYKENSLWKRGVVFVKEIVPKYAISFVANTLYGEKYATHRMRHEWKTVGKELHVGYEWMVGTEWNYLRALAEAAATPSAPGSEEEFITEHYWGYTFVTRSRSGTYQVSHPKWNVHKVLSYDIKCNAGKLYGPAFAEALSEKPVSVFLADGSPVSIMRGTKIFATVSS